MGSRKEDRNKLDRAGWQRRKLLRIKIELSERKRGQKNYDIFKGAANGSVRMNNGSLHENVKNVYGV